MKSFLEIFNRRRLKEKLLLVILIAAIWPSLFHIFDLLQLNSPKKVANLNQSILLSPVILVFDRETYFPKISFQIIYKKGTTDTISLDSRLFSEMSPYPVSVMIAHIFLAKVQRKVITQALDVIFCRKLLKSFVPQFDIATVDYQPDYFFNMPNKPETLRHTCQQ